MKLSAKLREISDNLDDHRLPDSTRDRMEQQFSELLNKSYEYQSEGDYITHIESRLGRARSIRIGNSEPHEGATTDVVNWDAIEGVADVDWRNVPLCGCADPLCEAKKGDMPAACRDASDGLLDPRSPSARVEQYLQRHENPHAIRVIHQSWMQSYGDLMTESMLLAKEVKRTIVNEHH